MKYLLIVDDTALNSNRTSDFLKDKIVSTCGYLLPIDIMETVGEDISNEIYYLKEDYNIDEFHFTEMYNRQKQYKDFTGNDTLNYLNIFTQMVVDYDLKIITQTITHSLKKEHPELIEGLTEIAKSLNLTDNYDEACCLLLTIINAKKYLIDHGNPNDKIVQVICDEGLRKHGAKVNIKNLYNYDLPLEFMSSNLCPYLQIADFCAWSKSRIEQSLDKYQDKEMKDFEQRVLLNLEPMQKNYVNLKLSRTNFQKGINLDNTNNK